VDENGEQLGIMPPHEAMALARERGLDLVEVAPNVKPPVCRFLDYGRYQYQQSKKSQEARRKQHQTTVKEIKVRPNIDEHDLAFKMDHIHRFLRAGDKVKITCMLRGRENARPELGHKILNRILKDLGDLVKMETRPKREGRTLSLLVSPTSKATESAEKAEREEKREE
jgi:translation initiation factor IF-3